MSKKLFLVLLLLSSMLFAGDKQSGTVAVGSGNQDLKVSKPTKPISQCDRLAGSPLDLELKGVAYKRIRVLQALKVCKQEIKKDPENPRTIFELGRVYNRAGELTLANKYYKKACDKGYPIACYSLGISYRNGEGVKKDIEKTLQYFKSSCQKGVSPACNSIGYIYEQKKRYETAAKYYKKACLLENGMGCSNLGALHFRKRIHSANDKDAVKMFKLGCAYGNKKSCAYLKRFNIVSDIRELKNDISQLKKNILTPKYKRPSWCNNEKILNETERAICQDRELSEQDLLMESLYKNYVKIYHETNSQKKWLLVRNECMADKSCLMKVYKQRIEWLDKKNDISQLKKNILTPPRPKLSGTTHVRLESSLHATTKTIVWQKTFGGTNEDFVNAITPTKDGSFIIAGSTYFFDTGRTRMHLIKVDKNGNKIWQKTFGGGHNAYGRAITPTKDDDFIVVGSVDYKDEPHAYLIKIDSNGHKIWQKFFRRRSDAIEAEAITPTKDGGFIVVGEKVSKVSTSEISAVSLIKIDSNGHKIWQKTFEKEYKNKAEAITPMKDGGFIVVGTSEEDVYLIKIDKDGNKIWQKTFGGSNKDYANAITPTKDGGFIVAGYTYSFGNGKSDVYLIKIDKDGNKIWQKTFGGSNEDYASAITPTKDGGFIVAGNTEYRSSDGNRQIVNVYLIKFR